MKNKDDLYEIINSNKILTFDEWATYIVYLITIIAIVLKYVGFLNLDWLYIWVPVLILSLSEVLVEPIVVMYLLSKYKENHSRAYLDIKFITAQWTMFTASVVNGVVILLILMLNSVMAFNWLILIVLPLALGILSMSILPNKD